MQIKRDFSKRRKKILPKSKIGEEIPATLCESVKNILEQNIKTEIS